MGAGGCPAVVAQLVAEHWRLKPELSWVRLGMTAGFLYFHLITSKFAYLLVCKLLTCTTTPSWTRCRGWRRRLSLPSSYEGGTTVPHAAPPPTPFLPPWNKQFHAGFCTLQSSNCHLTSCLQLQIVYTNEFSWLFLMSEYQIPTCIHIRTWLWTHLWGNLKLHCSRSCT